LADDLEGPVGEALTSQQIVSDNHYRKKLGAINMYAVMGITGNVGGAVARTLLAKGEKVQGNRLEF
jgi:hypothetical protein